MGRYSSSDSEEERRKIKKKKKRRSRSRSSSEESYSSSKRNKKSKKSKKKQRRRSRSRSSDYRKKRSRSRSRKRSRSRSRGRKSRSRSSSRYSRNRRSRSRSKRRSTSRPRRRSRSRSLGSNYSKSKRRSRSRSRSRSKNIKSRSTSVSRDSKAYDIKSEKEDPCAKIPGFKDMSTSMQNEIRMKLALKAAAETDARLREQGVLLPDKKEGLEMTYDDDQKRCLAISQIDGDGFTQQSFMSSKNQPRVKEDTVDDVHEAAMFGDTLPVIPTSNIVYKDTDSILGPMFYEDPEVKWSRWVKHVAAFRRSKLEGEEMAT